ncbi:MAG: hypothetical protein WCL23_04405 [Candidatus Moraniibacteriota bacterium]
MPQVFYVAQDEEILSIIGRLHLSNMLEIVFVMPKRALVLGSVVNLRLLAREAVKAGKHITIVTQDDDGRILAEKAGIPTRPYSEELLREDSVRHQQQETVTIRQAEVAEPERIVPRGISADSLGSSDFFVEESTVAERPIDHSRSRESVPITLRSGGFRKSTKEVVLPTRAPLVSVRGTDIPGPAQGVGRLTGMFKNSQPAASDRPVRERAVPVHRIEPKPKQDEDTAHPTGKKHPWFFFFAAFSILTLIGTAAILFIPKAVIDVTPKSASKNMELEFQGKTGAASGGDEIPVRVVSFDEEETVTVDASGASSSSGQKATGTVVMSNEYSTSPQQLVATTRLESSDGKIYRITKGVTIPGTTVSNGKTVPGVAELTIVADANGESYNIPAGTFTVPGFKGTPKFDKFTAKSTLPIKGGSSGGGGGIATITDADLAKAKKAATDQFRSAFESFVNGGLTGDERFVPESESVTVVGNPIHPETGFATASFEYRVKQSGKVFVFSESELKRKANDLIAKNASLGAGYSVQDLTLEYLPRPTDYVASTFPVAVRATALFMASVDVGTLRNDLLGKRMSDVQSVLDTHPEIGKVDISWPFPTSLPSKPNQITVTVNGAK